MLALLRQNVGLYGEGLSRDFLEQFRLYEAFPFINLTAG